MFPTQNLNFIQEYWVDAWQRSILTLDVLRERGNICLEHNAQNAPNVLSFAFEPVRDGRTLPRPVNYVLVRILPPADRPVDPAKPPFIVVDPRAGHGPGIGGMKQDSEIGVAHGGRPSLLLHRLPPAAHAGPDDRGRVRGRSGVRRRGRSAPSRGRRQACHRRQLPGRLAGHDDGGDPARPRRPDPAGRLAALLLGGRARPATRCAISAALLGGTWLTALTGDMGNGIFDGAHLVANFESLNPANTYWGKAYNVYSKVSKPRIARGPRCRPWRRAS